jgi:hypothetical protein
MNRLPHQKVTNILRSAGFKARKITRREFVFGYSVSQHGRAVAVLCGTENSADAVRSAIEAAGLTVVIRPGTSPDCLFAVA